ncbi:hypothetical protein C8F01DRAFT_1372642 [Mycena amicta]|nr:hypothetical protein C8F01DRAFT_1372642 [Mycena amicta]
MLPRRFSDSNSSALSPLDLPLLTPPSTHTLCPDRDFDLRFCPGIPLLSGAWPWRVGFPLAQGLVLMAATFAPTRVSTIDPSPVTERYKRRAETRCSLPVRPPHSIPTNTPMDSLTTTVSTKVEDVVLPPVNEDGGSGSSGSCIVCKEDTSLPPVNEDGGSGSSGSCIIA